MAYLPSPQKPGPSSSPGRVNVHYGSNNVNKGALKEIPEISVDYFHGAALNCTAFFLTHAHTDHMVGLEGADFLKRLNDPGIKIFCNIVTPVLLQGFEQYLGGAEGQKELIKRGKIVTFNHREVMNIKVPKIGSYNEEKASQGEFPYETIDVKITSLGANHCPGSIMYLFETRTLTILHTGDYRHSLESWKELKMLHQAPSYKTPKKIDHLYLDTTFCSLELGSFFPCRMEVLRQSFEYVEDWMSGDDENWISIRFAAKFAHEYMLVQLHERYGFKIHVSQLRHKIYEALPGLKGITTARDCDRYNTPFHFCENSNCREGDVLHMKLSCMWYANQSAGKNRRPQAIVRTPKRLNVCYSMHPSMKEVIQTIEYLKPKIVTPLVLPVGATLLHVKEALQENCKHSFLYEDYHSQSETINPITALQRKQIIKRIVNKRSRALALLLRHPEDIDPDLDIEQNKVPVERRQQLILPPLRCDTTWKGYQPPERKTILTNDDSDEESSRPSYYWLIHNSHSSTSEDEEPVIKPCMEDSPPNPSKLWVPFSPKKKKRKRNSMLVTPTAKRPSFLFDIDSSDEEKANVIKPCDMFQSDESLCSSPTPNILNKSITNKTSEDGAKGARNEEPSSSTSTSTKSTRKESNVSSPTRNILNNSTTCNNSITNKTPDEVPKGARNQEPSTSTSTSTKSPRKKSNVSSPIPNILKNSTTCKNSITNKTSEEVPKGACNQEPSTSTSTKSPRKKSSVPSPTRNNILNDSTKSKSALTNKTPEKLSKGARYQEPSTSTSKSTRNFESREMEPQVITIPSDSSGSETDFEECEDIKVPDSVSDANFEAKMRKEFPRYDYLNRLFPLGDFVL